MVIIRRNNSSTYFLIAWLFWHALCGSANDNNSGILLVAAKEEELSCSAIDGDQSLDPSLQEMEYDIGYGKQSFLAYVEPDVTTFYQGQEKPPSHQKVVPKFPGLATKFINNSNRKLQLYWEAHAGAKLVDMGPLDPFGATGSASHPGHRFVFGIPQQPDPEILHRVIITAHPNNTYAYDPYYVPGDPEATEANLQRELTNDDERKQYQKWRDTLTFSDLYLAKTGRSYIANYLRPRPKHWMWRADYFGQEHWVETRETHFVQHPPTDLLGAVTERGVERVLQDTDPRILSDYRDPTTSKLNMTLKVLSCAPRVFEIDNFLSPVEVAHILHVAGGITLGRSSVGDIGSKGHKHDEDDDVAGTRTSLNSWLPRESSPIFDAVYRRAADVMRIDEALLRVRDESEIPEWPTTQSVAESLQLVHYSDGQKYTAHHDFGFSDLDGSRDPPDTQDGFTQGTRFATLLLYLNNEGLEGGETTFPRWANAETFDQLRVKPVEGKAVLFYSQLPDGNLDDFSQHAALHPRKGEKWLMNLWVWDPVLDA